MSLKKSLPFSLGILGIISLLGSSCHSGKDKPTLSPPVKVTVLEVSESGSSGSRIYSGTVSSQETTDVSFSVAGTITRLYAREGDKVSQGQLLGTLSDGEYQNAYNIAEAQLAEAQDGYDRLKKLHDANALPEVKWVEIQQKLKEAQNMAEMAKRTLNDASLHSPVSGTVTRKYADVGQSVMPVEPVYEIVSTSDLTIDIPVSENEIRNFEIGEKAIVNFESIGLEGIPGKVSQKSVVADPLTRSFAVKVAIPSDGGKILPGMLGEVSFENSPASPDSPGIITLPSQAVLLNNDNRWFVWTVKDSLAVRNFVEPGNITSDGVEIISGLNPGEMVIIEGIRKVGTGTKVIPILR